MKKRVLLLIFNGNIVDSKEGYYIEIPKLYRNEIVRRYARETFFINVLDKEGNVCTVLDGDRKEKAFCKNREDTYFIPFSNIEDELYKYFNDGSGFIDFKGEDLSKKYNLQGTINSKKLYKMQ